MTRIRRARVMRKYLHHHGEDRTKVLPPFDKYDLYLKAVQSPEGDVEFLRDTYFELKGKHARALREDFCGTAAMCAEWVKMNGANTATGVDLDPEPLAYGRENYLSKLSASQRNRVQLLENNVLAPNLPRADISVALNFSYFLFKTRPQMKEFLRNTLRGLRKDGIAIFDLFGGSQCYDAIEDRTKLRKFTYYWEQTGFDPVSNEAQFHIHFRVGSRKYERVFSYDWRMWSIPELKELMEDVGFKKIHVYWEGTTRAGTGNGVFKRVEKGEACLSWICYLVAEK